MDVGDELRVPIAAQKKRGLGDNDHISQDRVGYGFENSMAPQGEVDLSSKRNCSVDSHMEWYQHDAPGSQRGPCSYNNIRCLRVVGMQSIHFQWGVGPAEVALVDTMQDRYLYYS